MNDSNTGKYRQWKVRLDTKQDRETKLDREYCLGKPNQKNTGPY